MDIVGHPARKISELRKYILKYFWYFAFIIPSAIIDCPPISEAQWAAIIEAKLATKASSDPFDL